MADELDRLARALADRIERELGAGGMATVYLAGDLKHHRRVAIKVADRSTKPGAGAMLGAQRRSGHTPHLEEHLVHERFLRQTPPLRP